MLKTYASGDGKPKNSFVWQLEDFKPRVSNTAVVEHYALWQCSGYQAWIRIRILDPEPAIFGIDLHDANKKLI
jgi:hypothetical protein